MALQPAGERNTVAPGMVSGMDPARPPRATTVAMLNWGDRMI